MLWLLFLLFVPVSRLEEKELDTKKECSKLHERYTDVSAYSLLLSGVSDLDRLLI